MRGVCPYMRTGTASYRPAPGTRQAAVLHYTPASVRSAAHTAVRNLRKATRLPRAREMTPARQRFDREDVTG